MSRATRVILILISLLAVFAGMAATRDAPAARQETVATLLIIEGTATVTPQDSEEGQAYERDDVALVNIGDQIAISEDGEGLLTFFEGIETRLVAGTVIAVQELKAEDGAAQINLSLTLGQAMSSVEAIADAESRFEIDTPAATISVRGTQFVVFVRPNQLTQVATLVGTVAVSAQDQTVDVPCGYGVKVAPGEAPGAVNIWQQVKVNVSAPAGEVDNLPVMLVNTDNDQVFHYRASDLMTVVSGGPYEITVNSPAPYRLPGITFPAMTELEVPQEFDVQLAALILNLNDEAGSPVTDENLIVSFMQDDLTGTTTVLPGDPIPVAPGVWNVSVALESEPEQLQEFEITVEADALLTMDLSASDFGSSR
jgi:hypothetical protein